MSYSVIPAKLVLDSKKSGGQMPATLFHSTAFPFIGDSPESSIR